MGREGNLYRKKKTFHGLVVEDAEEGKKLLMEGSSYGSSA